MSHKHKSSEPPRNTDSDKPNESVEKHTHRTDDDEDYDDDPNVKSSFNASQIKPTRI